MTFPVKFHLPVPSFPSPFHFTPAIKRARRSFSPSHSCSPSHQRRRPSHRRRSAPPPVRFLPFPLADAFTTVLQHFISATIEQASHLSNLPSLPGPSSRDICEGGDLVMLVAFGDFLIHSIVAGMVPSKEMNFRCIHCGFPVETLFIQYSPGNIRLMKCENCRSVADEYIECEIMILLIDLVLHKSKAYHHLLNNFPKLNGVYLEGLLWKSALSFMLLDAYRQFVLYRSNEKWVPTRCSSFPWLFGKLLLSSFFGILVFLCILYPACKYLQKSPRKAIRFNQVLLATLVSSYFKIVLIAMMVWQFPVTAIFIIDMFALSSNAVALKVLMQITMVESVAACIIAHSAKLLVNYIALLAI